MAPCFQDWGISINLHPDSPKAKALGLPSPVGPAAVYRLVPSFSGLDLYSDLPHRVRSLFMVSVL